MLKKEIEFRRPNFTSSLTIQKGLLENCSKFIEELGAQKFFVVADEKLLKTQWPRLKHSLIGKDYFLFPVRAGEGIKTFSSLEEVLSKILERNPNRNDCIISFGGGSIGDLAGFAASIILRGINLVQVPTTLLAMVDSSVGGKTAINTHFGKNLIGSFYQPSKVLIDPTVLDSLPKDQFANGMAEVIKYSLIADSKILDLELPELIQRCIEIKSDIVSSDEEDKGQRQILNFGHTLGHALEVESNYKMLHGEAVALGMLFAIKLSEKKLGLGASVYNEVYSIIKKYHLPTEFESWNTDVLMSHMQRDKKVVNNNLAFILLEQIGKPVITQVESSLVKEVLEECLNI